MFDPQNLLADPLGWNRLRFLTFWSNSLALLLKMRFLMNSSKFMFLCSCFAEARSNVKPSSSGLKFWIFVKPVNAGEPSFSSSTSNSTSSINTVSSSGWSTCIASATWLTPPSYCIYSLLVPWATTASVEAINCFSPSTSRVLVAFSADFFKSFSSSLAD